MQEKTITITIDEQGNSTLDLNGFVGRECEKAFEDFRGGDTVKLERKTAAYYVTQDSQQERIRHERGHDAFPCDHSSRRAKGPGLRAVVFFQGCTLGCKKCFNPTTHIFQGVEVARESRRGVGRGSSGTYPRGRNVFRRRANATSRQLADFNAKPAEQGASTERLRTALKIIDAVSQGRMLFVATCNSIASLPPELRRRFTLGTFFFDLPTAEERETIWRIYLRKYDVSGDLPDDDGWTGAEIKECCRKAHRLGMTLAEASRYIVPVSRSAAEQVKALRQMASGKFISAATPGLYRYEEEMAARGRRVIRRNELLTILAPPRSEA